MLSPEVGFSKCEVVSIPPHPSKGFQRPLHLFTKSGPVQDNTSVRYEHRDQEQKQQAQRYYWRDLFPTEVYIPAGNNSGSSQRSTVSLSQYESLENVYAPLGTPSYLLGTPAHINDGTPNANEKLCYAELNIPEDSIVLDSPREDDKVSEKVQDYSNPSEETIQKMEEETSNCELASNDT